MENKKPQAIQSFMKDHEDDPSCEFLTGQMAAGCGACVATAYGTQELFSNDTITSLAFGFVALSATILGIAQARDSSNLNKKEKKD